MAYKRKASGTYVGGRRYVRRRVMRRRPRGRIVGRTRTARGSRPNFMFHRWVVGLPAYSSLNQGPGVNFNSSQCGYTPAAGIIYPTGSGTSASSYDLSVAFCVNDLPNWSEFSALFDQYRLNAVVLQIKMCNNPDATNYPGQTTNNFGNFYPTLWYSPDYDDNNIITLSALKEYERVKHKVLHPNRECTIVLRPRTLTTVYNNSSSSGYATNFKNPWLDCANPNIPHYGLKMAIDFEGLASAITGGFVFKINAKYYFQCKNVR